MRSCPGVVALCTAQSQCFDPGWHRIWDPGFQTAQPSNRGGYCLYGEHYMIHFFLGKKLKPYFFDVSAVMTESRLQILCTQLEGEIRATSIERERENERFLFNQAGLLLVLANSPKSNV